MAVEWAGEDIWRSIERSFWVGEVMMMMGRGCD